MLTLFHAPRAQRVAGQHLRLAVDANARKVLTEGGLS